MEGMNMQVLDMIDQMMFRKFRIDNSKGPEPEADSLGFPFEPLNAYSDEPLGFLETTMRLQTEASVLFNWSRKLNHLSPLYAKAALRLERMIRALGSCCVTKAVLEQEGKAFPMIEDVTVGWLRRMAAFSFRKCYAAFMDAHEAGAYNTAASDLSLRFSLLDKRLQATEEKIEKIRAGKVRVALSEPARNSAEGAEEDGERGTGAEGAADVPAFREKAAACPVDKGALRELTEDCTGPVPAEDHASEGAEVPVPDSMPAGPAADPGPQSGDDEDEFTGAENAFVSAENEIRELADYFSSGIENVPDWLIRSVVGSRQLSGTGPPGS